MTKKQLKAIIAIVDKLHEALVIAEQPGNGYIISLIVMRYQLDKLRQLLSCLII